MKKLITLVLALVMLCNLFAVCAGAEEYDAGWFCDDAQWKYDPAAKTMTISKDGFIHNQGFEPGKDWQRIQKEAEVLTVAEGVTGIDSGIVRNFEKVTQVHLPGTLKSLGGFDHMAALQEVTIPDSVTELIFGFAYCENLTEVHMNAIPQNEVRFLEGSGYAKDPKNWKNGVLLWNGWALSTSEEAPEIPEGTVGIGIEDLSAPLHLPASVRYLGSDALTWTNGGFTVDPENTFLKTDERGCLFSRDGKKLIRANQEMEEPYTVPEGVEEIGSRAFEKTRCPSVTMPDSVKELGEAAFYLSDSLKEVRLSENLEVIEEETFASNHHLKKVVLPKNIKRVESRAFSNCIEMEELDLGEVQYVGEEAFTCALKLKSLSLPEGIRVIRHHAFYGLGEEEKITIPESAAYLESEAFFGDHLKEVTVLSKNCQFEDLADETFGSRENLTVCGYPGSTAQKYAAYHNCPFRALPEKTVPQDHFADVSAGDWYYDCVRYVTEKNLMNGVEPEKFDPENTTTRAMIVTILHRLAGSPQAEGETEFRDVSGEDWFAEAVAWASEQGIVNGMGEGQFAPEKPITREQFAVTLLRYAKARQENVSENDSLSGMEDRDRISSWAEEAMKWCVGQGYLCGSEDNGKMWLCPQGEMTRAEAAMVFMRWMTQHGQ